MWEKTTPIQKEAGKQHHPKGRGHRNTAQKEEQKLSTTEKEEEEKAAPHKKQEYE